MARLVSERASSHMQPISRRIHSSRFYTLLDDSLKDEDNVGWVMQLSSREIKDWITILQWVRVPDRLLERDRFEGESGDYGYANFVEDWRKLRRDRSVSPSSPFAELFRQIRSRWQREKPTERELRVWDQYLDSLKRYVRPSVEIVGMKEYRRALFGLSGTFFQALPHAPKLYKAQVGMLGMLDQFFNNLRDLFEDTKRGICYYPLSLLEQFRISPDELSTLVTKPDRRFVALNQNLLSSFASGLQARIAPLLLANPIDRSWRLLLENTMIRHNRVEYVMRLSQFNAREFRATYWDHVRKDIRKQTRQRF